LESTKINPGTLALFREASARRQRWGTSTAHRAELPSTSFRDQSPAGSRARPEALAGPTHLLSSVHAWPSAECRTFRDREARPEAAYSCSEYSMIIDGVPRFDLHPSETAKRSLQSNKEIDWYVKELRQPLRLCLANRAPATQYFSGSSLVAQDWPDVLVLQPAFFHQRAQRFTG
jgi:hypothetical protein